MTKYIDPVSATLQTFLETFVGTANEQAATSAHLENKLRIGRCFEENNTPNNIPKQTLQTERVAKQHYQKTLPKNEEIEKRAHFYRYKPAYTPKFIPQFPLTILK